MIIPQAAVKATGELPRDMHKGNAGKTLIVAGSPGMAGAAVLSARGALHSGAGIVKCGICEEILNVVQICVPEAMCVARNMNINGMIPVMNPGEFDSIAVGPGLGSGEDRFRLIINLLLDYDGPVVIDADGLNSLALYSEDFTSQVCNLIRNRKGDTIMTPHPGEADRLLKAMGEENCASMGREKAARLISERTGAVTLLKGSHTIVAQPGEEKIYMNETGNPGMASGGSGDVLTGVIAAILAKANAGGSSLTAFEAASAGAFIHGLAGDIAAEKIGEQGMCSGDIADNIADAIRVINNGGNDGH